ncbi:MAG: RIP metalloprotease RseP [Deferribacteraceae bacterium]|jgi:regulator of sigma E protease|nr:RIP metalloprotease RseP [Deferribacteraceae bacterium]
MSIILAIVALGILILVHELGHFITAKLCGVWVERFSIGMGPIIWSKKRGDTEYAISAVPLGGYVKLHRMFADEEAVEGREDQAFFNKSIPKKLLVITAGVLFNMLFAVLVFVIIFMAGYKTYGPIVGTVAPDGIAAMAGMQEGDRIVSVDGADVRSWDEFLEQLSLGGTNVTIERAASQQDILIKPNFIDYTHPLTGETLQYADIGADFVTPPVVGTVSAGFPAAIAGIQKGDTILKVAGIAVSKWADIGQLVRPRADMLTEVIVQRGTDTLRIGITPQANEQGDGILGIMMAEGDTIIRENPAVAFVRGIERTGEMTAAIIGGIKQLITGKVSKDNLGGPILIVQEGARSAEGGYERYLSYMGLISINLAILNLLPIPVLDGGYVIMFIYEGIRRKRMGVKMRERGQMVGMALLGLLMVFAFYNDIFRFLR